MTSLLQLSKQQQQFLNSEQEQTRDRLTYSLLALFYKNIAMYKKNYCSNLCQLLTPIICIAFTIAVRVLTQKISTGSVGNFSFVQPFHLPITNKMMPGLKIHCTEMYFYSFSPQNSDALLSKQLFSKVLKTYCSQSSALQPKFVQTDDVNKQTLATLFEADKEQLQRGVDLKTSFPDGLIKIHELSKQNLNFTLSINDWRLPEYHKNNGVTKLDMHSEDKLIVSYLRVSEGLMSLMEKITRSYLQLIKQKEIISGTFMYMPFEGQDRSLVDKISNVLGSGLYPLGLSLLLPIFLYSIVSEKQERLIQIMKMNGLLMKYYWINFFFFNLIISLLSCGLLYVFGRYIFQIIFFTNTNWIVLWVLFLGWCIAQISLTSFIQIFINSSKAATIIGYLLSIFSTIVGQAICTVIYPYPSQLPLLLKLYPPIALSRGVYLIGNSCANNSSCYRDIFQLTSELYSIYAALYGWIFMFVLSIYLHSMIQQQYGTTKLPPFLKKILKLFAKEDQQESNMSQSQVSGSKTLFDLNILEGEQERLKPESKEEEQIDESVTTLSKTTSKYLHNQRPLIIKNLSKVYQNNFTALKANTFHLQQKQIFGLLGPNGAGKTTLISVLTGLYESTSGEAWIDGKQIGSQQANTRMGVCPQFDLLWENLTISEHMYFYALLKGVKYDKLQTEISLLLKDVDLIQQRDMKSSELSGGMRRRLSLAIALIGSPKVVILDQPSSGLDPSHRRQMWDILLRCKKNTTILLTTHLMEEAEALCDRIGIINKGLLRCIGTQKQLKQKFGKGYRLTINFKQENQQRNTVVNSLLGLGCQLVNNLQSRVMVKVPKEKMLDCVKQIRKFDSLNWLLSQPSLYDVFMHFIN